MEAQYGKTRTRFARIRGSNDRHTIENNGHGDPSDRKADGMQQERNRVDQPQISG
jgi:hypothetical protein